ncbi:MAG TPA: hypothetical protein PK971_10240 [Saprospiraceae bacterium]|nr:hypothetical protein [Saprospiraceae bacterium]
MRFAKFFFAVLFGAAVIVTFFKLLFFAAFMFALVGGVFFLSRLARRFYQGGGMRAWHAEEQPQRGFFPHQEYTQTLPIQPLDMPTFRSAPQRRAARIIEVM